MEQENQVLTSTKQEEDFEIENKLRPTSMSEYVGQEKIKESLDIYIKATKKRDEALDHVLLYGPPGLGKTTLSHIIAGELGTQIKITSGPAIENAADLAAILTNLGEKEVLFIGGKNSNYINSEDHIVINNFFPNAKIEMVEGAGHWIHAEKPEEFLTLINDFLR